MHNVATTFASAKTTHQSQHCGCVFFMIMKISQVIFIKPYCIVLYSMHHAHTSNILEAPIFYVGGKGWLQQVNHSVPGVNMQDVSTL